MYMGLLILTVVSIWVIKHFRLRFIHETGLAIIYGVIVGLMVRYLSDDSTALTKPYQLTTNLTFDEVPDDDIYVEMRAADNGSLLKNYTCHAAPTTVLGSKLVFDPEIFFYVLLPPIIFHAGYSMKRRHFFRNFGAIITYAFIGTIVSAITIGGILYGFVLSMPVVMPNATIPEIRLQDCFWYGSIISATDPVTVLAIFHDLNVDVDLYALVFGESVLNDAVAITLAKAIDNYKGGIAEVFKTIGMFMGIFLGSFTTGLVIGCTNALLTKFTKIKEFPLLESALLLLMSYSSYLIAEACEMSGIVAVLFCGIFQAHYTFNNLSDDSKKGTKEVIEVLNFITENFVFLYIGVSVFTRKFQAKDWNLWFIFGAFLAMIISRLVNIYPLTFFLNIGRKNKISASFQHMMMFSGLRGAIAFALAVKNAATGTQMDNIFLTTTIVLVMVTVIGCGALALLMLQWLKIRVGVEDTTESQQFTAAAAVSTPPPPDSSIVVVERSGMVKIWNNFDNAVLKPIFTHYRSTLAQSFPNSRFCKLLSRVLTTTEQLEKSSGRGNGEVDSDVDIMLDEDELTLQSNTSNGQMQNVYLVGEDDPGDLGIGSSNHPDTPMLAFM
ncbi:sodium/hydrogen exchanger 9-like isoform X2 [Watersipora subatra]|uniref:sodium/hydrogen exchanger 9-like isoform X2 n=1 Tax=Watersipora subatra TaxID=2589382 RepID=UPI00355AEA54